MQWDSVGVLVVVRPKLWENLPDGRRGRHFSRAIKPDINQRKRY